MKYLYTTLILTILIFDLSGQARMSSGKLSVGSLTTASETLEVFGDAQVTGQNPFLRFKLTDATPDASDESGLHWKNSANATNMRMLYSWLENRLYFLPDTDQNLSHFTIENATGHVGVNVRNPQEQFHINGKMLITDDIRIDGSEYIQFEESGVRKAYLRYTGTNLMIENDETNGNIIIDGENEVRLYSDDLERMTITKEGDVGIGNFKPSEKLDVVGNITIPATYSYGFDESGVNKAAMGFNGTNMLIENDEVDGSIIIDGENFVSFNSNDVERMRIANNGNVGVGIGGPSEKLHVNGGIRIGAATGTGPGTIRYTGSDFEGRVGVDWVSMTGGGGASLWTAAAGNTYVNAGNVGIGTTSPAHKLQVNGNIGMTGEIIGVSDMRTKKDVRSIDNATAIIKQLRPVHYEFARERFANLDLPQGKQFGFVAQEVNAVLPELVSISAETEVNGELTSLKGINYIQMIPVLTQAMQEQQSLIDKQQKEIDELKTLVKQLVDMK